MQGVGVVIAARNEEAMIEETLGGLDNQTLRPALVVVVDDGSVDATPSILAHATRNYGFDLGIVTLAPHVASTKALGLSKVFDSGLAVIRQSPEPIGYVMKLDADHLLPEDYIERVVARMEIDPGLAVASGWVDSEPYVEHAPAGSSFVVNAEFWKKANGMRFLGLYSWEQWIYFKAMEMGFRTRCFKDIRTHLLRQTSTSTARGIFFGRGMYELGYDWRYAVGRCMVMSRHSPSLGVHMLAGYLAPGGVRKVEISSWVGKWQRSQLPKLFTQVLRSTATSNQD